MLLLTERGVRNDYLILKIQSASLTVCEDAFIVKAKLVRYAALSIVTLAASLRKVIDLKLNPMLILISLVLLHLLEAAWWQDAHHWLIFGSTAFVVEKKVCGDILACLLLLPLMSSRQLICYCVQISGIALNLPYFFLVVYQLCLKKCAIAINLRHLLLQLELPQFKVALEFKLLG